MRRGLVDWTLLAWAANALEVPTGHLKIWLPIGHSGHWWRYA